jgi:NTE family protein
MAFCLRRRCGVSAPPKPSPAPGKERGQATRPQIPATRTFALVIGAGGARSLAAIPVIEALDEMQLRPTAIAGTSLGALVGAAYAAGMTGAEIRRHALAVAHDRALTLSRLAAARAVPLSGWLSMPFGNPLLIDAEKFCAAFVPAAIPADFADLAIPLTIVAADLYGKCERVFTAGPLKPALAASMAIPGLVQPLQAEGRILVDGGAINPLPFDHLRGVADFVVAIECSAGPSEREGVPDPWECLFATIQVMGQAIVAEKIKAGAPDLILRPNVGSFRLLDFFYASAILRAAAPIKAEVKEKLGALIGP